MIKPTAHVFTLTAGAKDGRSAISGTDHTERQGLRGPLAGILLVLLRYDVCFPTTLVSQLQLWHISCLVSVRPVGELQSRMPLLLYFTSHRDADTMVEALSICEKSASIMQYELGASVLNGGLRAC